MRTAHSQRIRNKRKQTPWGRLVNQAERDTTLVFTADSLV